MSVLHAPEQTSTDHRRHHLTDRGSPGARPCGARRANLVERFLKRRLHLALDRMTVGRLRICDGAEHAVFGTGGAAPELDVQLTVRDPRAYTTIALSGSLGAAEAYVRGYWDTDDLMAALRLFLVNGPALSAMDRGGARLLAPARALWRWWRRNTRAGSRRNIAEHYDLSNDFFSLMLDPTMTYSSGIFPHADATLEEASLAKYDRICRKLALGPRDEVLEIGTGWGGFAIYAAREYGCRVTTTTISAAQFRGAQQRIRAAGLEDRVRLLQQDYRDLQGTFDKLVSIEMIEAVGEQSLDTFFRQCARLLKPDGMLLLQAITIADCLYDDYRRSIDFINRYIFPGGFLPSLSAMLASIRRRTDFRVLQLEEFGDHYVRTLSTWRENFLGNLHQVYALGFDNRFVRLWDYYLCYCSAGFRERNIGVSQLLLTKPHCRRAPILPGL
ncbi:MAG: cyclopropane-fatty-acyl-phospholipid synthase family protein [Pirellulaceae bacterium]|nr:cyclopropane-fatty-acyl-phospholipid synthase family protein [Pirellulaceae bacterium]